MLTADFSSIADTAGFIYTKYSNGSNSSLVELYTVNNGDHIWFNFLYEGQTTNQLI
tara:strand:- start:3622 stop:3789 length:168 start_codon:yes stop_codon:yes gene_type:complete